MRAGHRETEEEDRPERTIERFFARTSTIHDRVVQVHPGHHVCPAIRLRCRVFPGHTRDRSLLTTLSARAARKKSPPGVQPISSQVIYSSEPVRTGEGSELPTDTVKVALPLTSYDGIVPNGIPMLLRLIAVLRDFLRNLYARHGIE